VEAVASGAAVTRDTLVNDAADYIGRLREHMNWEEGDLFKRADSLVAVEQSMFLDISHLDGLDPVFGPEREHTFANLLENIRAFAEET
jgi:hemerythrin-like domain-containing protein